MTVDVHVTDTIKMLDYRYARITTDPLNQSLTTSGDYHIHKPGHGNQFADSRPVGGFHDLYGTFWQS